LLRERDKIVSRTDIHACARAKDQQEGRRDPTGRGLASLLDLARLQPARASHDQTSAVGMLTLTG
jgi:hypothetical protein